MIYRRAKVIDNDDSSFDGDKLSRIQVQIYPEMKDINDTSKLPWVEPFFNSIGISSNTSEHTIPEIDSWVTVIIEDEYWTEFKYLKGFYINGYTAYSKWEQDLSNKITDIDSQTYPQPHILQVFEDGSAFFRNTDSGEMGYIHNSGSYFIFDKDGQIFAYTKQKNVKIYNDKNSIEMDYSNDKVTVENQKHTFTMDGTADEVNIEGNTTTCNLNCLNVNLGGDSTLTNGVLKGTDFQTAWDILYALLQSHVHDSPQAPSGTLTTTPPIGSSGWTNPVTNNISQNVKTG